MMKRVIVGSHHKTGSVVSGEIMHLLVEFIPGSPRGAARSADIPNEMRKEPLSYALEHGPRALFNRNIWCEHTIDIAGIRFLHFVRHPLPRIASGYLYHKRGAPTDEIRWPEWPIFEFRGRKSYTDVLNALDLRDGLLVEAIRTFPEALGSARSFATAARLPAGESLPVWLDRFEESPRDTLSAIFRFVYGEDDERLGDFLAKAESREIVLNDASAALSRGHVTRNHASRRTVDEALASSPEIGRLYGDIIRTMGAEPAPSGTEPRAEVCDIVEAVAASAPFLLASPRKAQATAGFWSDPAAGAIWPTFALSNFANGHLMMQPFIQALLTRLA